MHWPIHYKIALSEGLEPSDIVAEVDKFLGQPETVAIWAKIYRILSHPIIRPKGPLSSKIVILSSLGHETLITQKIGKSACSQDLDIEYAASLVEAARGGHQATVDILLQFFEPTETALELSISSADYRVLFTILKCTSRFSEQYEYSTELLCREVWLGLDDAVKYLTKRGVAVDFEPLPRMSPLHLAVQLNYKRIVKILISAKADINWRAQCESTPLDIACFYGSLESVKLLLEAKANIEDGWSLLQTAAYFGQHEIVKTLLNVGAYKSYPGDGRELLIKALIDGFSNCCHVLLEAGAPTTVLDNSLPPLFWAVYELNKEMCKLLLENGADPNWKAGSDHQPILNIAVLGRGSVELVKLLLDKGADINIMNESSKTRLSAISAAALYGLTEVVKYLAERKADVNLAGSKGRTPIYFAARANHPEIIQILMDSKADIEMDENLNDGWGPLLAGFKFPEVVRILLKNGADINRTCSGGKILFLASKYNHIEVVKVCLQYKLDLEIKYHHAEAGAYEGDTALGALLEAGANINQRGHHNSSPLQYGFINEDLSDGPLRAILEYRPDLNLVDDNGDTALHCLNGNTPLSRIKLLVNAGADIEIRNENLMTPLGIAIKTRNIDAVEYFLSKNAEVNLTGGRYGGPLLTACSFGDLPLLKLVVEKSSGINVNLTNPNWYGTALQAVCARSTEGADDDQFPMVSYLLDNAKANINASGGWMGYALSKACLKGDSSLVKFLLDKGAKSDVADWMGRKPIHLAALRTIDHWNLLAEDNLLEAEDQLKRIPLHYAVVSGKIDLAKAVLECSIAVLGPTVVNYPDCDNWTPIMWAVRTCGEWGTTMDGQPEIIKLLLSNGANLWMKGEGLDRAWSPLRVARYYGAREEVIELLTPRADARSLNGGKWDHRFHTSKKASMLSTDFRDGCLFKIVGIWFTCQTCWDFYLCFKCYRSRDALHPDCLFEERGTEYESEPEASPDSREKTHNYDDNTNNAESHESPDEESEEEESISSNDITGNSVSGNVADSKEDDGSDDDEDEDEEDEDDDGR
ncbi:hypothetical protein OCU04_004583 [Sclerotinia nivalis]|uniref:Uncharacterized protein n=1 Tax=Sclerotinia nivalis TaxID=352851 RepID=A0A9X0DL96_9HELO|nr:hypothetical protein OCU04_004583 [Sclerotinia nivalis]